MNILAIGNSFSQDATRYLHGIARADKLTLNVANLYIGGCSLDRHYRNWLDDKKAYELQFNGHCTGFSVSLKEALSNRSWDIVTLQQVSYLSGKRESYQPYASELAKAVRLYQPKAKLIVHQTWAYEDGSKRLTEELGYGESSEMIADVKKSYSKMAKDISADGIIPSGELFAKLLSLGVSNLHRDTFHASLGKGRYALALLWYRILTGRSVTDNGFSDLDAEISESDKRIIKDCVMSFSALPEKK